MKSYRIGKWRESNWRDIDRSSKDLFRCAAEMDRGIVSGGDTFQAGDVASLVKRLDIIVCRLRELSNED